jgi:hypothetical protein
MPDVKDPKTRGAIIREPEAAGTPIERKDPTGKDIGAESANPTTVGAPDQTKQPLPDPFFWPEERSASEGERRAPSHVTQRDEIDEIMARAMRLRSVEANRICFASNNRNAPDKHVWRASIMLLSADGATRGSSTISNSKPFPSR